MKEEYKYVKNMLSQDIINFLSNFSLQNNEIDTEVRN